MYFNSRNVISIVATYTQLGNYQCPPDLIRSTYLVLELKSVEITDYYINRVLIHRLIVKM